MSLVDSPSGARSFGENISKTLGMEPGKVRVILEGAETIAHNILYGKDAPIGRFHGTKVIAGAAPVTVVYPPHYYPYYPTYYYPSTYCCSSIPSPRRRDKKDNEAVVLIGIAAVAALAYSLFSAGQSIGSLMNSSKNKYRAEKVYKEIEKADEFPDRHLLKKIVRSEIKIFSRIRNNARWDLTFTGMFGGSAVAALTGVLFVANPTVWFAGAGITAGVALGGTLFKLGLDYTEQKNKDTAQKILTLINQVKG